MGVGVRAVMEGFVVTTLSLAQSLVLVDIEGVGESKLVGGATANTGTGFGVKMSEIEGDAAFASVVVVYGIAALGLLFDMDVVAYGIAAAGDVFAMLDISATLTMSAPNPLRPRLLRGAFRIT